MAIRLIRENSDTPNITNKDDARMIRYAYGGQNGYVKGRGAEFGYSVNGNVFTVNSGVLNIQGWEVEIDSNGWSTTLSASDAAKKYFAVYCEVNLALGGSAKIELMSAVDGFPSVPEGDDLTENPSGTARLILYNFVAQSGNISEVQKIVEVLTYGGEPLKGYEISKGTIEERLTTLGFKLGVIVSDFFINDYSLTRQGNYVIGNLSLYTIDDPMSNPAISLTGVIAKLPKNFMPKNELILNVYGVYVAMTSLSNMTYMPEGAKIKIDVTGEITIVELLNSHSKDILKKLYIYFGFEAEPIK